MVAHTKQEKEAVRDTADEATRLDMYRMMVEARLFERRVHDLFLQGLVKGTSHLGIGQEAITLAVAPPSPRKLDSSPCP